jgi:hypothetical protein
MADRARVYRVTMSFLDPFFGETEHASIAKRARGGNKVSADARREHAMQFAVAQIARAIVKEATSYHLGQVDRVAVVVECGRRRVFHESNLTPAP